MQRPLNAAILWSYLVTFVSHHFAPSRRRTLKLDFSSQHVYLEANRYSLIVTAHISPLSHLPNLLEAQIRPEAVLGPIHKRSARVMGKESKSPRNTHEST